VNSIIKGMPGFLLIIFLNFGSNDDFDQFFPFIRNFAFAIGIIIGIKHLNTRFYDIESNYYIAPFIHVSLSMFIHIIIGLIYAITLLPMNLDTFLDIPFYFMYAVISYLPLWLFIIVFVSYGYYMGLFLIKVIDALLKWQGGPTPNEEIRIPVNNG
jgi:hypothetical protein